MSLPEVLLWGEMRGQKLGFKVRRQHPVGPYIADFYVSGPRLIIEIDGQGHDCGDNPIHDERRDQFMIENGYDLLRLSAADVLQAMPDVIDTIVARATRPLHHPADGPPPRAGEDL